MTEPKFTPGPWRHTAVEGGWDGVATDLTGWCICKLALNIPANADLIAAAPELYEALKFIFEHIADKERGPRDLYPAFGLNSRCAIDMAAAALAKARGESMTAGAPIRGLADPLRDRREAALDLAVRALREIERLSQHRAWGDPRAGSAASEALARIETLVPEIDADVR